MGNLLVASSYQRMCDFNIADHGVDWNKVWRLRVQKVLCRPFVMIDCLPITKKQDGNGESDV